VTSENDGAIVLNFTTSGHWRHGFSISVAVLYFLLAQEDSNATDSSTSAFAYIHRFLGWLYDGQQLKYCKREHDGDSGQRQHSPGEHKQSEHAGKHEYECQRAHEHEHGQ
jgi:hypothetical protein